MCALCRGRGGTCKGIGGICMGRGDPWVFESEGIQSRYTADFHSMFPFLLEMDVLLGFCWTTEVAL